MADGSISSGDSADSSATADAGGDTLATADAAVCVGESRLAEEVSDRGDARN